jgi:hypothetical protein
LSAQRLSRIQDRDWKNETGLVGPVSHCVVWMWLHLARRAGLEIVTASFRPVLFTPAPAKVFKRRRQTQVEIASAMPSGAVQEISAI